MNDETILLVVHDVPTRPAVPEKLFGSVSKNFHVRENNASGAHILSQPCFIVRSKHVEASTWTVSGFTVVFITVVYRAVSTA